MSDEEKPTGGKVNYYLVKVDFPQRAEQQPYQAECEDIIHALGMTFDEGCEFKAIWRTAAARKGTSKPGRSMENQAIYDAEKRIHYANRSLTHLRNNQSRKNSEPTEPKSEGWIEWKGGNCPVAKTQRVRYKVRDNPDDIFLNVADMLEWKHWGTGSDIIVYKLVD